MKEVFISGEFSDYRRSSLNEARESIDDSIYHSAERKVTVFISHKHDDLEDLNGIIGFLERKYNVKCYIDSRDPSMPDVTSGKTAKMIKQRIKQCDKFILLASNGAIDSKWCNWELGFGDAQRFKNNIALFPFRRANETYKGNEYMEIYPHIVESIVPGNYYVKIDSYFVPLSKWLER